MKTLSARIFIASAFAWLAAPVHAQQADSSDPLTELSRMSLEQLSKVEVTSVSKSAQSLASARACAEAGSGDAPPAAGAGRTIRA